MLIEIFNEIPSTQSYLKQKIYEQVAVPDHFVLAYSQTNAVGTYGRKWYSPKGDVLTFSFTISAQEIKNKEKQLVFFIAYTLRQLLKQLGIIAQVKWVNDIYYNNKKLAGILVEHIKDMFIVGIGLNLNQKVFEEPLFYKAISLYQIINHTFDSKALFQNFIQIYNEEKEYWFKDHEYFWGDLENQWQYQNKTVQIILPSGKQVVGTFYDINKKGEICIKQDSILITFMAGTLRLYDDENF